MLTELTPEKREKFLAVLRETGSVSVAAAAAVVSRATPYNWRKADEDFAAAWDEALGTYVDSLEAEADRRGVVGVERPVFYAGQKCGTVRDYSDTLLIFRLKALRPEKYRERAAIKIGGGMTLEALVDSSITEIRRVIVDTGIPRAPDDGLSDEVPKSEEPSKADTELQVVADERKPESASPRWRPLSRVDAPAAGECRTDYDVMGGDE